MKFLLIISLLFNAYKAQIYTKTVLLMGSRFDITVVATNKEEGDLYIEAAIAEIGRIEKLISSWDSNSQISRVNRSAGLKPESVDKEVFVQHTEGSISTLQRAARAGNLPMIETMHAAGFSVDAIDRVGTRSLLFTTPPAFEPTNLLV